jgi:hypothetical protein
MRTIRGKTRYSRRILRDVYRVLLSVPERLTYEAFHALLDFRLWLRWRQFERRTAYVATSAYTT